MSLSPPRGLAALLVFSMVTSGCLAIEEAVREPPMVLMGGLWMSRFPTHVQSSGGFCASSLAGAGCPDVQAAEGETGFGGTIGDRQNFTVNQTWRYQASASNLPAGTRVVLVAVIDSGQGNTSRACSNASGQCSLEGSGVAHLETHLPHHKVHATLTVTCRVETLSDPPVVLAERWNRTVWTLTNY